ncbi:MAG: glycerol-3-phosphate responsive antiterminator [Halanaerobiales bacterium]
MRKSLEEYFADFNVVAGLSDDSRLEKALYSKVLAVFLLNARLSKLQNYADKCRRHEKMLFLHLDMMKGMSSDKEAVNYLAENDLCKGIITTHKNLIKYANQEGLFTIQRIFALDSGTIKKGILSLKKVRPDAVEILPGLMAPNFLKEMTVNIDIPFIAGGLIRSKKEVDRLLNNGVFAVSTSEDKLWY